MWSLWRCSIFFTHYNASNTFTQLDVSKLKWKKQQKNSKTFWLTLMHFIINSTTKLKAATTKSVGLIRTNKGVNCSKKDITLTQQWWPEWPTVILIWHTSECTFWGCTSVEFMYLVFTHRQAESCCRVTQVFVAAWCLSNANYLP